MDADESRNSMSSRLINPDANDDLQFWVAELGCTEVELRAAIAEVGDESAAVALFLARR